MTAPPLEESGLRNGVTLRIELIVSSGEASVWGVFLCHTGGSGGGVGTILLLKIRRNFTQ